MAGIFEAGAKWKILSYFLDHPTEKAFVNELARRLKMGGGTCSRLCLELEREALLLKERAGNSLFYSLNGASPLVKKLKTTITVGRLEKLKSAWESDSIYAVALYGSHASGNYREASDIDLLVIASIEKIAAARLGDSLGKALGKEVNVVLFAPGEWMKLARKVDPFYTEAISSHVLLKGESVAVV